MRVMANNSRNSVAPVVVGERIQERLRLLGMSQAELGRRVGLTQPAIANLIHRNKAGTSHLHRIARELATSPAYLAGETDDPSEGALPAPRADEIAAHLDSVLVPQVEMGLSMGGGAAIDEWPIIQQVPLSRTWLRSLGLGAPEGLMIAPGVGDSMMPTILDGDWCIIDRSQNTPRQQDRIWALTYGGWGMIKRLRALPDGTLQINSDNPAVSPIIAYEGEAQIIGRVGGVVRRI